MSEILVKPEELRASAAALHESAKRVQTAIDNVDQQIRSLGPARFEGMAADAIRAKYARMREQFYSFKPLVERIAGKMELFAVEFTKVDQQNT
ncbi:MAG: WXG100 family type VII secretion target [Bellilinea sp.]|nr:WXG100 family type VII secretion target [Bellilinea sp.]